MNGKKMLILGTIAATALAGSIAYAAGSAHEERDEAQALAQARTSLVQAIEAAERHAGGKAVSARLEDENGRFVYEVEVIASGKSTGVKVDSGDGKVLSAPADEREHENGDAAHEREEHGEH
jgi:uncharacterized membrane protein YkoI